MKRKKYINRILLTSMAIIILASLEAFVKGKSLDLFQVFQQTTGGDIGQYINFVMLNYLLDIIEPLIISLFLVFAGKKLRINGLMKFVLCGMIVAKVIMKITKLELNSIFYYLVILLYILLFVLILKLPVNSEGKNDL